ncbi:DivIVA domain-containing protein [Kitasatospora sp. NPDC059327]|uniref:DivIVA domain-containing protein n=1 Tax=Kitasatospora sp. NPDC059327 TaxID=3346803 RepID=UPI00367F57BE
MPLTPAELRARTFSTVRLRESYDEGEVDEFLDLAEAELTRLLRENENLRAMIAAAVLRAAPAVPGIGAPAPAFRPPGGTAAPAPAVRPPSTTDRAAHLLETAQRIADQAVAGAHAEARSAITSARIRAEAVEGAARARADALERDTRAFIQEVIGGLEATRAALEAAIQGLRSVEREQHSRLRSYLEQQVRRLGTPTGDGSPAVRPGPARALPQPFHPRPPGEPPPGTAGPAVMALPRSASAPIPGLLLKRVAATVHRAAAHSHPAR